MPIDKPSRIWSAETLAGVGFVMLLLTSLEGWGMVGVIAFDGQKGPELLHDLKRLHNLGLTGSFLAICFGLALLVLPLKAGQTTTICRVLLPSLLIAPLAFCDRMLAILLGSIPSTVQALFYVLQAASASGITLALGLIVFYLFKGKRPNEQ